MRNSETFHNPILSGFYPDPSICRVGDDYYMATSSFHYYPGIPIFHSKDLIHWEQIGHGIHRKEQLDYKNCEASLGLWAPTIRYHEGTFYLINTFVSEGREVNRDNYILTAKDPAGPWSDPVFIKGADGIDPTVFFDEDGRMWYAGNFIQKNPKYEGHHGIYLSVHRRAQGHLGRRTHGEQVDRGAAPVSDRRLVLSDRCGGRDLLQSLCDDGKIKEGGRRL